MFEKSDAVLSTGGLASYTADEPRSFAAAIYVDKILKGAKPVPSPRGRAAWTMECLEFIVSLKSARSQIGSTIPPNVLVRAARRDSVIVVTEDFRKKFL